MARRSKPDGRYRGVEPDTLRPPPMQYRDRLDDLIDRLERESERPSVEVHVHSPQSKHPTLTRGAKVASVVAALAGVAAAIHELVRALQ